MISKLDLLKLFSQYDGEISEGDFTPEELEEYLREMCGEGGASALARRVEGPLLCILRRREGQVPQKTGLVRDGRGRVRPFGRTGQSFDRFRFPPQAVFRKPVSANGF